MSEEGKKARREYMKNRRKNNKDKLKVAQERYWQKKALELKEQLESK